MHRVFVVRFHAIGQVSLSGREIYVRQMFGSLLSASDEGESEEGNAVFRSQIALTRSWFGASSRF
jgi:hypothetical protein